MLACTQVQDELGVSRRLRAEFWMPDYDAKKGDRVVVWTRRREPGVTSDDRGTIINLYWGHPVEVWTYVEGICAVLIEVDPKQFLFLPSMERGGQPLSDP